MKSNQATIVIMNPFIFNLSPKYIVHIQVEINYNNHWYNLEGIIIDKDFLRSIQHKFPAVKGYFCGYGLATDNLENSIIDWNENYTYIQKEDIIKDLATYDNPDTFFSSYCQNLNLLKKIIYTYLCRHFINSRVNKFRNDNQFILITDEPPCNLIVVGKHTIILQRRFYYFLLIAKSFPEPQVKPVVFKIQKKQPISTIIII